MDEVTAALRYAQSRRASTLRRLSTLLRFPTVSAEPRHSLDMSACAAWLAPGLGRIGLTDVKVWRGQVAPMVTAAWHGARGAPTVLVYGHYDVQPVAPLTAWATDPFRPVRIGPHLYARGASDDKGQFMAHLAAIEAWLATSARLPVNLRLVLDGEEEIGSPTLVAAVAAGWRPLAADVALVSDTWMLAPGAPVLITGLRGVLGTSLEVSGPRRDLHAGAFGGAVTNPAEVLATLVASLHDKAGRVAVAGFYDEVRPMAEKERQHLARAGPPDSAMLAPAGAALGHGEPGFSAFERVARRPAVVVTDLRTSGEGRTVIPARATAEPQRPAGGWPGARKNRRTTAAACSGANPARDARQAPRPERLPSVHPGSACPGAARGPVSLPQRIRPGARDAAIRWFHPVRQHSRGSPCDRRRAAGVRPAG